MRNSNSELSLDDTDYALMALIQRDGRASNVKLARELNMSEASCWRRLKRLEEAGCIRGYRADLNRRLLGFGVFAFVHVCFAIHSDDHHERFQEAVQDIPEVLSCHNITGQEDYILQIVAQDLETYERLLHTRLRRLPGVTSIKTSFSLRELKASSSLPL